eukprot:4496056-Prymnesium_polylepis.1
MSSSGLLCPQSEHVNVLTLTWGLIYAPFLLFVAVGGSLFAAVKALLSRGELSNPISQLARQRVRAPARSPWRPLVCAHPPQTRSSACVLGGLRRSSEGASPTRERARPGTPAGDAALSAVPPPLRRSPWPPRGRLRLLPAAGPAHRRVCALRGGAHGGTA